MTRRGGPHRDERTGTWSFVVDLPPGPDGNRRQARRRGFPTKKAAQGAMDKVRVSAAEGNFVAPQHQTLGSFLRDEWLPAARVKLQPSTWASYERNLRLHVIPAIGGVQLQSLDPAHLNRLYADLLVNGCKDTKAGGLSLRTVRYVATIIGAALDDAMRWGRVIQNVARLADPPSTRAAHYRWRSGATPAALAHVRGGAEV